MLLRGEMAWRGRLWALALIAAILSFGLVSSARASDARHFEKVSPADKGNGDVIGDGATNVASRAGDAVTLSTRTPFGDTIGSGVAGQTQYVSRRGADAWTTHSITPQPRPEEYQTFFGATRYQAFSDDLRTAVVWGYDLPAATGDLPRRNNIYVQDTASRALQTVTMLQNGLPDPLPFLFDLANDANWGVSADARHVAFVSLAQYLPEAAAGVPNVYQWDDGVLSLAGVLPDGTVSPNGSDVVPSLYRSSMSLDGRRLVFTSSLGGNLQLFTRIDGSRTHWISETELDPSDPNYQPDPSNVTLKAVSPDGRIVFFTTDTPLVSGDTNGDFDLYRYTESDDPSTDSNLTLVTDGGMNGALVMGMSDDGGRVYYETTAEVIFAWDHGTTDLVTDRVVGSPFIGEQFAVDSWGPGMARVTPDGDYLAFATRWPATADASNGFREMYLYSLSDHSLRCVSCPSGAATGDATVIAEVTSGVPSYVAPGSRPRFLSEDGKVFFSSAEALVPEDINGVLDAYEYDPATGDLSLVSSGKGSDPATFVDASASGDDVFFVTRQRLTASDHDDLVDLYDARDGDALPEIPEPAEPPVCQGELCQPPPSGAPDEGEVGSLTFDEGDAPKPRGFTARKSVVLHSASGSLRVRLSAAGKLSWRGKGLRSGSVRRSRSGTVVVRLRLGRQARAKLRTSGVYRTSIHLTFASANGDVSRTTRVTFKAAAKKGR